MPEFRSRSRVSLRKQLGPVAEEYLEKLKKQALKLSGGFIIAFLFQGLDRFKAQAKL